MIQKILKLFMFQEEMDTEEQQLTLLSVTHNFTPMMKGGWRELPFSSLSLLHNSLPSTAAQISWLFLLSFNKYVPGIVLRNNGELEQWWSLPRELMLGWRGHALYPAWMLPTPTGSGMWAGATLLCRSTLNNCRVQSKTTNGGWLISLHLSKYWKAIN